METDKPPDCLVLAFDLDAMGIPRDDDPALLDALAAAFRTAAINATPFPPVNPIYMTALKRRWGRDMAVLVLPSVRLLPPDAEPHDGHPGDWPTDDIGPIGIDWIVPPQGDDDDDPAEWWKHQGDDHAHTE